MAQANFIALPAYGNIIDETVSNLISEGNDYSKSMVIFPNKRPAHFLRKKLASINNSAFIPPPMYSIDEFIDHIYEREISNPKLDYIDAVNILYKLHKSSKKPLGGKGFLELDSFLPLGFKIFNDIEELCIENISVNQVKNIDYFVEGIPLETLGRLQTLSFFYEEFYKSIDEAGYSTRASRYRKAIELIKKFNYNDFKRIILAGFFALTKAEVEIFKEILSWDNSLLIFKEATGIDDMLKKISIDHKSEPQPEQDDAKIYLYSSPDSHGQIFGLSRLIKDRLEKDNSIDEKTLILSPTSDSLMPLIYNCLSNLNPESYNISMGYPIIRTPLFGFFNNLMELILSMSEDKIYIPSYLKFVLHPYPKNILFNSQAELTRIIFHTIEEELLKNRTKSFITLLEIEENERLIQCILTRLEESGTAITKDMIAKHLKGIHQNTINRFKSFKDVGDFANKCIELLTYIYENSTARLHAFFYPFSETFLLALQRLSKSLIRDSSFKDLNSYFIFFKKYMLRCQVPFEGTPVKGLQVLGFLETRNLNFENLYIIDLNEGVLPSVDGSDSLIPFAARKALGLPTYLDSDRIAHYYFETLIKGAKEVHIFFVESDKTEKSRFIEKILWQRQKREQTLEEKSYIRPIQYKVDLRSSIPKEIEKTEKIMEILKDFKYTSSCLDTYLKCNLAFYYIYVLKIHKKEEVSGEIERSDIGIFVHSILRNFFSKIKGQVLNEKNLNIKEMERLLESMCKEKFGDDLAGAAYLIKRQLKNRLKGILKEYYLPLSKKMPIKIMHVEHEILSSIDAYQLQGRLDSVELRGEKSFIIDYKTSSYEGNYKIDFNKLNPDDRDTWSGAIGSIQLPFYMSLYSKVNKVDISNLNALFLLLGKNTISEKIELPFCAEEEKVEKYKMMEMIISQLLDEINDIDLPFLPPKDLKVACKFCDYKNICGT
ncbi:MAG: PD-(D/E)XK nuclease family protein [Thermodesulfovibrionales bacterium]|nr:PD-(D/E)XK nuclease family protein [Thermodesulfovibrionales bacterium]